MKVEVRDLVPSDRPWATDAVCEFWGSNLVVTRGKSHDVDELPGLAAVQEGKPVGVLHYACDDESCEVVSLISLQKRQGIGSMLLRTLIEKAQTAGLTRIWLITTNDNLEALGFYQRKGFRLCALYPGAVERSRRRKPEIPPIGSSGIPIRDEIELEWHG